MCNVILVKKRVYNIQVQTVRVSIANVNDALFKVFINFLKQATFLCMK